MNMQHLFSYTLMLKTEQLVKMKSGKSGKNVDFLSVFFT